MSEFSIGVDLGGTNLRIAAVEAGGKMLKAITTGTAVAKGREHVVDEMCEAIRELRSEFARDHRLSGIGIGVPGIIDLETGMVRESPNLAGWHDYPVKNEIERRLETKVILENDANAAAIGETWLGAAKGMKDVCMLTLGTGLGGGIVLDGKVWHGMRGMAGELGHITYDPNGPRCGCGNRGCIEQYASAVGVRRMMAEAIANGAKDFDALNDVSPELIPKEVFQLAKTGNRAAQDIYHRFGDALGTVLASLVNALNLPLYVVGGGVSNAWEMFEPSMLAALRERSFVYAVTTPQVERGLGKRTQVVRAGLGSDAGLLGAAYLAQGDG